jgi:hypothetical protein
MKPKITVSDRLRFIAIQQNLLDEFGGRGSLHNESDGVKTLATQKRQQLNNQADAILQPKPRKPSQPRNPKPVAPAVTEHGVTGGKVIPVPDGLQFNESAILKRGKQ